jgi:Bifunctional DNA primase/polymerase, N-terminal
VNTIQLRHSIDNPRLAAALAYAARGWPVFPCHGMRDEQCTCGKPNCAHPGKHPLTRHGCKDATTDPQQIEQWWTDHPDANVAIATGASSGLMVLDLDPRHGGQLTLDELEATYGGLPETVVSFTGGGGRIISSGTSENPFAVEPMFWALASTFNRMGGTLSLRRADMPAVETMNGRSLATLIKCPLLHCLPGF